MMLTKDYLYNLLNKYICGEIKTEVFCDEFTIMYAREVDDTDFSIKEEKLFGNLWDYTKRFSPFEEDLKLHNVYCNEEKIREKAEETAKLLGIIK